MIRARLGGIKVCRSCGACIVCPQRMTTSGSLAFRLGLLAAVLASSSLAAVDPEGINERFSPANVRPVDVQAPGVRALKPEHRKASARPPEVNRSLQQRRASIDLEEARSKRLQTVETRRPAAQSPLQLVYARSVPLSQPTQTIIRPATVAKYQRALDPASAVQVSRLPALSPGASVTINRFVFTKAKPVPSPTGAPRAGRPVADK